jgi:hypothetical protein
MRIASTSNWLVSLLTLCALAIDPFDVEGSIIDYGDSWRYFKLPS